MFAGHCVALVAGLDLVFGEFFAASFDVAVLASNKASRAVGYLAALSRYSSGVGYVGFTDATVHSARSNKIRSKHTINDK